MNKTTSVLAVAGTLAFFGAGAAQAVGPVSTPAYVGDETSATVSDATVAPGETVVFSSNEGVFTPGEIIDITVDFTAGEPSAAGFGPGGAAAARGGLIVLNAVVLTDSVKADANGNFSYSVELEEEGTYTLTATGRTSGETVTARVVVDSEYATAGTVTSANGGTTTSANGKLANTGIDSAMLLWGAAGIGALGLGAGSIFVARRRAGAEA
ncbi:LPXTG cell wall anchor domain-containing protein [Arthrobacter sp. H41]|uniref:LPXTG cell wall anchor domain-containing protein n=1 Tax=Arthrobacter sp. H41 TaxID=1312978 RepID=UPI00047B0EA4|nr:LPXTG cell wall anchor domain-containing protein [Arthrobacter sp. H41]